MNQSQQIIESLEEAKTLSTEQARDISASWAAGGDALQVFTTHGARVRSEDHRKQLIKLIGDLIRGEKKKPQKPEDLPNLQSLLSFVKKAKVDSTESGNR